MQNKDHVRWSRNLYASLRDGGTWTVPRSGLTFRKREPQEFELISAMPYEPSMQASASELLAYQQEDYEGIKENMAAAGIRVTGNFDLAAEELLRIVSEGRIT